MKKIISLILIFFLSSFSFTWASQFDDIKKKGDNLVVKKQYSQAAECYEELLKLKPESYVIANNLGFIYAEMGDYSKALELYHKALSIKPGYKDAENNILAASANYAQDLIEKGKYEATIKMLAKIKQEFPNAGELYYYTGVAYQAMDRLQEAVTEWRKSAKINPNSSIAIYLKGLEEIMAGDNEKAIRISFPEKIEIYSICLYDNPSPTDNILDAVISFSDGTFVKTGALNENGAPTEIIVNKNDIHNFSIVITESEGNHFGLAEIEAFSTDIQNDIPFIKITDSDGNFVYDYYTDKNTTDFSVYSNADLNKISLEEYSVYCSNNKCSVQIIDGRIRLDCPLNEECIMSLSTNDGISDTIHVYLMNSFEKLKFQAFQLIEGKFVYPMSEKAYYDLASYRFIHKLISFVQRG